MDKYAVSKIIPDHQSRTHIAEYQVTYERFFANSLTVSRVTIHLQLTLSLVVGLHMMCTSNRIPSIRSLVLVVVPNGSKGRG